MLKAYSLAEIPELRVLGRTTNERAPLTLFWTASGAELQIKAKELWIKVRSDYEMFEPWVDIVVDGALVQHRMVEKGEHMLCVFRNMEDNVIRNVKILRDSPAFPGDEKNLLQILEICTDGQFYPLEEPKVKLEFIGDSITSGEGGNGAGSEMTWNSFCFHAIDNYAYMTAEALEGIYHCISQSGWGVYCSWEGKTADTIPPYYEQICGVVNGEENRSLGAFEPWDFAEFQPDVIVINLGTNDACGTKELEKIQLAAQAFLGKIRRCNPHSYLIWCYGMFGDEIVPVLKNAVDQYRKEAGDKRVKFVQLPDTLEGEFGSRQHPGHKSHEKAAAVLTEAIRGILHENN